MHFIIMIEIIKKNIKQELKKQNKSVNEFTEELKVNRNYISSLTDQVKLSKIIKISDALGVELLDILKDI